MNKSKLLNPFISILTMTEYSDRLYITQSLYKIDDYSDIDYIYRNIHGQDVYINNRGKSITRNEEYLYYKTEMHHPDRLWFQA